VGKWHKKVGEPVNADEPVVVLETDKVTIDVPAPSAGALSQISHPEGDKVKIGDVLGVIAAAAQASPSGPQAETKSTPAPTQGGDHHSHMEH
jgi:2-oxoglutarate dehydrogenase E2 component (dihydrolipoamide succinyltransferase)